MYESITKYLSSIDIVFNNKGDWIVDIKSKGDIEDPSHFPWVKYKNVVCEFMQTFYDSDFVVQNYYDELEKLGWKWDDKIILVDVESLDSKGCLIFLTAVFRGDHFCEGSLLECLKNRFLARLLNRLSVLDNKRNFNKFRLSNSSFGPLDAQTYIEIDLEKKIYVLGNTCTEEIQVKKQLLEDEIIEIREALTACLYWGKEYIDPCICDGHQWEMKIGKQVTAGNNAYPCNYNMVLRKLQNILHSDDDVLYLGSRITNIASFDKDSLFDSGLLCKGKRYFEEGKVSFENKEQEDMTFKVMGTETYVVNMEIDNLGYIYGVNCDCPVQESYCKHSIACLYWLQNFYFGVIKRHTV